LVATISRNVEFSGITLERLKAMVGGYNAHLKLIEQRIHVKISHRGSLFVVESELDAVERAESLLERLYQETEETRNLTPEHLHLLIQGSQTDRTHHINDDDDDSEDADIFLNTRKGKIVPRGANQKRYVQRILESDISFGIGPAGGCMRCRYVGTQ
jgi:phosphate starvation-inducible PhoH-like protein